MPIRSKFAGSTANTAAASAPPETSGFQKLRSALGFGTRLAGGWASNMGGLPGAALGGGSELAAETIEGSLDWGTTPARVGTEAAIGMIPLGKTISAGRALKSAVKGAGFNAVGDVGRQWAEGNFDTPDATLEDLASGRTPQAPGWDPYRTAFGAALGGSVNAALGHFGLKDLLGGKTMSETDRLTAANAARKGAGQAPRIPGRPSMSAPNVHLPIRSGSPSELTKLQSQFEHGMTQRGKRVDFEQKLSDRFDTADAAADNRHLDRIDKARQGTGVTSQEARRLDQAARTQGRGDLMLDPRNRDAYEKEIRRAYDEASQEDRLRELKKLLMGEGQTSTPSYAESLKGYSAEGTPASARFRFANEAEEEAGRSGNRRGPRGVPANAVELDPVREEIIQKGMSQPGDSQNRAFAEWLIANPEMSIEDAVSAVQKGVRPVNQARVSQVTGGVVPGAEAGMDVANQGRLGPVGSSGGTLDELTNANRQGPLGYGSKVTGDDLANQARRGPVGYGSQITGDDLANQARRGPVGYGSQAGAPPLPSGGKPPKSSVIPAATEEQGLQDLINFLGVDEGYRNADAVGRKALGEIFGRTKAQAMASNAAPKLADETGASTLELLLHVAGAGIGAAIGGAMDENGSPIEGALVGGAIGAGVPAIPKLLQSVNISPESLNTPEGIKEAAKKIINTLPTYQRAAYLSDLRGIGPNMWAGPYGSMMTGALEAGLKGDQRGWEVIKRFWRPDNFLREWKNSFGEATELIRHGEMGRAEGMAQLSGTITTGLQAPGVGMTMGDVAARRMLMQAGFSLDEAKTMTLTSEPVTKFGQNFVRGANSTLGSILFPFRRTPINIAEQGANRLPFGIGAGVSAMGDSPGSLREAAVETGLGTVASGIGYGIGTQMDDPRSTSQNVIRRTASNLGGRYSLPVTLGMFAGQTVGQGKNITPQNLTQGAEQMLPLPSVGQIVDPAYWALSKIGLTGNENPRTPRGMLPFQHLLPGQDDTQRIGRFSRIRKR